jgi:hypothetical protein
VCTRILHQSLLWVRLTQSTFSHPEGTYTKSVCGQGSKEQEANCAGENCLTRIFMPCTLHHISLRWLITNGVARTEDVSFLPRAFVTIVTNPWLW